MTEPTVIDATAEEMPGTEVVPSSPPAGLFKTDDPAEVIEKATAVANALKGVLEKQKLVQSIQGKAHVKVEGWTTLGAMLGINAVCVGTERLEDGGFQATVEARTADGRVVGRADALCSRKEARWRQNDDYALLSMAQTRATSKALRVPLGFVVALAGYSPTPAEEMVPESPPPAATNGPEPAPKPLGLQARLKVVDAINESDWPMNLVLSAVGRESVEQLTKDDAHKIRKLLDDAKAREAAPA